MVFNMLLNNRALWKCFICLVAACCVLFHLRHGPHFHVTSYDTHTHTHRKQVKEILASRWMTVWLRHLKPVTSECVFIWILLPAVSHAGGRRWEARGVVSLELQQQECKYYGESHWDMKCSFNYNTDISRSVSQRMWRERDLFHFCRWFLVWFGVHAH